MSAAARREPRPRLLFVSPQFLFPLDAGGKIRTTNILKRMKGGAFDIHLISPGEQLQAMRWTREIHECCDRFTHWHVTPRAGLTRAAGMVSPLPVSVWCDALPESRQAVRNALAEKPDVVVFDFTHAGALMPDEREMRETGAHTILFTHNVETEIFARHAQKAGWPMKPVWMIEHAKMRRFEKSVCERFDTVIAVSKRDADALKADYGARHTAAIPTGVDLDFFTWHEPAAYAGPLVFTGSMDWRANQDGLMWFLTDVWPLIVAERPETTFKVIGKNPPERLVNEARARGARWTFTGFVDDIRPHAADGSAYVIPLRVGGGTRIKAFEAMAMGLPVVSTHLGVEGLGLTPGRHYLQAEEPAEFAARTLRLLAEPATRTLFSRTAREHVEAHCSQTRVAQAFEKICIETLSR